jgi:hypothetical protein
VDVSILIISVIVLVVLFFVVREWRATRTPPAPILGRPAPVPARSARTPGRHPAYDIPVGTSKDTVLRRLGEPSGGRSTGADILRGSEVVAGFGRLGDGFLRTEYWLYENAPRGHDTKIVISARGVLESLEVVPHAGNPRGVPRHVISAPDRRQPMAARWAADRESVLASRDDTARALAEFAETAEIEDVELGLTDRQKEQRYDRPHLDAVLDDPGQPAWMRAPVAVRAIGRELDRRGGFSLMQDTYYRARELSSTPGRVSVVELLWDRIGDWER